MNEGLPYIQSDDNIDCLVLSEGFFGFESEGVEDSSDDEVKCLNHR